MVQFTDQPLIRGNIPIPDGDFLIEIESGASRVVHRGEYYYVQ